MNVRPAKFPDLDMKSPPGAAGKFLDILRETTDPEEVIQLFDNLKNVSEADRKASLDAAETFFVRQYKTVLPPADKLEKMSSFLKELEKIRTTPEGRKIIGEMDTRTATSLEVTQAIAQMSLGILKHKGNGARALVHMVGSAFADVSTEDYNSIFGHVKVAVTVAQSMQDNTFTVSATQGHAAGKGKTQNQSQKTR